MKNLVLFFCLCSSLQCFAQITGLSVEIVMEHDGAAIPELAGHTTYRVYADVTSNADFVSAVYGNQDSPLMLGTDGTFFQDPISGNFAQSVVPLLFPLFPTLEFDSWLTIGISNSDAGSSVQNTPYTLVDAFAAFNAGDGFVVNDPIGGLWFNMLQCLTTPELCAMEDLAFGGADNRVLLAQLTSTGHVYGTFNMQVFPAGDQNEEIKQTLTFSSNEAEVFGCTNPAATGNEEGEGMYDPAATIDDFSCILPCSLSISNVVSPICEGQTGSNTFFAEGSQGGLTWDDDAYEVFVSPSGDLDGTATLDVFDVLTFLKSYGIVCDACEEDINEDGSVSTADLLELLTLFGDEDNEYFTIENPNAGQVLVAVDNAGCEYSIETSIDFPELVFDECGICGGEGVPDGDCDCYGNQDDAIGECGGDCESDSNANGVCDDEENFSGGVVVFQVDMNDYSGSYGQVNLNGGFNGWCGGCAVMTDDDGDNVYQLEVDLAPGTYEYKFTLDGWSQQEMFEDGDPCTSTIDGFVNRTIDVSESTTLDVVCYNSCGACDGTGGGGGGGAEGGNITFQVDLGEYTDLGAYAMVNLNGSFNGWCGTCAEMTDDDGDNIYELTIENMPPGIIEYKFTLDGWAVAEEFAGGEPCTLTTLGYTNRVYEVAGDATLCPVCWGECESCNSFEPDGGGGVFDQQCDIDFDFGEASFGVSPDPAMGETFLDGMLDESYFDILHILIPANAAGIDSTYPPTLPVDSVIVLANSVDGAGEFQGVVFTDTVTQEQFFADEIGLEVLFNNNGDSGNPNAFMGGEQYCAAIQGAPNRSGVYRISIDMQAWATIFTPFNAPYTFDNFSLSIGCEVVESPGCIDPAACNFDENTLEDDPTSCNYPSGPCEICSGELDGSGEVVFNDLNGDGQCDAIPTFDNVVVSIHHNPPCGTTLQITCDVSMSTSAYVGFYSGCSGFIGTPQIIEEGGSTQLELTWDCGWMPAYQCYEELSVQSSIDSCWWWDGGPCIGDLGVDGFNGYSEVVTVVSDLSSYGEVSDYLYDMDALFNELTLSGCLAECGNGTVWSTEAQECIPVISADLDLNGCVGAPDLLELLAQFGECIEQATSTCEGPVEYQGYDYQTVMIGGQCWFAENLRSVSYRNGDLIPCDLIDNEWSTTQNGATAVYCQQNLSTQGGGFAIPDEPGQCFSSEVTVDHFDSGQTIVDAEEELEAFFINMEHSFMGDLTITVECPNGQGVMVHQQGGGGTFLGVPVDNDSDPANPGQGFDYFWTPDATNGTWAENAGGTLPPGEYESAQAWSNLNGCPLNGVWQVEICDLWGSDNGFVFNWGVQFYGGVDVACELGPNDETPECDPQESLVAFGRLYNWYAVNDSRGLCPSGWHVPTDGEWMTMEVSLGLSESEASAIGWRGTDQGAQLKSSYGWLENGNGTNTSGFSGLPGGSRLADGSFQNVDYAGFWWSSSPNNASWVWGRNLSYLYDKIDRSHNDNPSSGFSVRCIQDSE